MKSLIVIFGILIVGFVFVVFWDVSTKPVIDQTNYNEISWRLPLENEIKKVKESFLKSDLVLCASYFIKKYEGEKYLIACDSGNGSWTYYTAYTTENKVYLTSVELTAFLLPPEIRVKHSAPGPIIQNPPNSIKTISPRETIESR